MKNKLSVLLLSFLFASSATIAQVTLTANIPADKSGRVEPKAFIQTTDGGYAVSGYVQLYHGGTKDIYVAKLDSMGNVQWTRAVGGPKDEEGSSIVQTKDGGFAVAGYTTSYGAGGEDVYVVKLDAAGNVSWTKTIGGKSDEHGFSILETKDGSLIIAGSSDSYDKDYEYIIKLDKNGTIKWNTGIPGSASSIVQARDGGIVVCGTPVYPWQDRILLSKLDTLGNTTWNKVMQDSTVHYSGIVHDINK